MTHKLFGVQAIHRHNHTQYSRVVRLPIYEFNKLRELPYNSELNYNEYYNLNPGMYKVKMYNRYYSFILHETLTKDDKLIIKNPYNIFSIDNVSKHNIILYKLYDGLPINKYGHILYNTPNDYLEALIVDGKTEYEEPINFNNPGKIKHLTELNIRIRDRDGNINDQEFILKTNLKSIGSNIYDKKNYIHDTLYLDSYLQKALYEFNLGHFIVNEYSIFETIEDNNNYVILFLENKNIKLNSHLISNYFKSVDYNSLLNNSISCISSSSDRQGIYFKIYRNDYGENIEEFKNKLANMDDKIEIVYEYPKPVYSHILLDNYKIPIKYGNNNIVIVPFNKREELNNIYDDDIEFDHTRAYVSESEYFDDIYVSANINLRSIYFYKQLDIPERS